MLPAKAPGVKRAMGGTNSGECRCPQVRVDPMAVAIGDCLQLKLGNIYVPCEVLLGLLSGVKLSVSDSLLNFLRFQLNQLKRSRCVFLVLFPEWMTPR